MRNLRLWLLLPLFLVLGGPIGLHKPAQTAAPIPLGDRKTTSEASFSARFADGSSVRFVLLHENLSVKTAYGQLVVPAREVSRIEFGMRVPTGTERAIRASIVLLGSKTFLDREKAGQDLLALGPASYRPLQEATSSSDPEVARRAKELVTKLESRFSPEELHRKTHDIVHTPHFPIAGHLESEALRVRTTYFGTTTVKPADLWEVRSTRPGSERTIVLEAARHALQAINWFDTGIDVSAGRTLSVKATGQIDMYPLPGSVGTYLATPAGASWPGGRMPGLAQVPGMLVGRIGSTGGDLPIGAQLDEVAKTSGRLFLRIVPSPWGNPSTGQYHVTVSQR